MSSPVGRESATRPGYPWSIVALGDGATALSEAPADTRLELRPTGTEERVCNRLDPTEESAVAVGQVAGWTCEEFRIVLSDLYFTHRRSLVRLAALWVDGHGEDAVQDAFVQVWLKWEKIHDRDKVLIYVQRAVVNTAKSELRRRRVSRRHPLVWPGSAPASEDVAMGILADEAIVARVRRLSPQQAACVGLRFYMDMSEKEIAEVLGISTGSVKQHTSRAMRKLAPMLGSSHD